MSIPKYVIGSEFCEPNRFNIIVETSSSGHLLIKDGKGGILLQVIPQNTNIHHQRVLLDAEKRHIVTLREKHMTEHGRWNAFRGNSIADSDMLFTTKRSHMIQRKTAVDVLLASTMRSNKDACDFKIRGSWSQRSCAIYVGDSSTTIAQMQPIAGSVDRFEVAINHANVDYAFVVALIAIVDAMKSSDRRDKIVDGAKTVAAVIGGALSIGSGILLS